MESLNMLESKILSLIDTIKSLKEMNKQLVKEKNELLAKIEMLENSLLADNKNIEELKNENMLTKIALNELISNIDKIVEKE
jgi:FtsZ-binding cell division protein ZapB